MSQDTGGPAFPTYESNRDGHIYGTASGLDLRDYFAAKAMQMQPWHDLNDGYLNHAERCYSMADAMLKARES